MFKELNWLRIPGSYEYDVANYDPEYDDGPELIECHRCRVLLPIEEMVEINFDDEHEFFCQECVDD